MTLSTNPVKRRRRLTVGLSIALVGCWWRLPEAQAFLAASRCPSGAPMGVTGGRPSRGRVTKTFARNLSGGLDPPFHFGDNGDGKNGDEDGRQPSKPSQSFQQQHQQRRQQQPRQEEPASSLRPPSASGGTKSGNASGPLKLEGFMEGSQKLVPQTGGMPYMSGNNYVDLLVTLSPTEMISNFKAAAPPRVQEAVRRTVLRCIGSIRDSLVEDSHRCTGLIFAHLLYKAQVTGYMLFNAEVKVQGIVGTGLAASAPSLPPQQSHRPSEQAVPVEGEDEEGAKHLLEDGKSVRLGGALLGGEGETDAWLDGTVTVTTSDGTRVRVDAQDYVQALRQEAASLKGELVRMEGEQRQVLARDLLAYISDLSARQSGELTEGMTRDVVEAMKVLTSRVLVSIQEQPIVETESMEVDSTALAQLIMWGLVTGYSLRELERAWNYGQPATPSLMRPPSPSSPSTRPRGRRPPPPPPPPRGSRGRGGDRPPRGGPAGPPGGGGEGGGGWGGRSGGDPGGRGGGRSGRGGGGRRW
ncbi:Protein of unknown function DUF760 [Nannochloropsis gaditana]|uniref:Uncharacterized protein n=1 Tax=Nannochloropsis gaditana TaxID=72520 RepID=W7U2M8_9STRA|nr:Protein of unknown function DUF760 [Nannochloropsis gaditana]